MSNIRTSPAVERTLSILNFLGEHDSAGFTLSELCRRLNLAKATAHTILATLVNAGFVTRNTERQYFLGPSVIPLGEAASSHNRAVAVARREMQLLADELGLGCVLTTVVEDSILVVGKTSFDEQRSELLVLTFAKRIPLVPPIGAIFVAWWNPQRIERWLDGVTDGWEADRTRRLILNLSVVRERGYSVSAIESDSVERVRTLLASVNSLSDEGDLSATFEQFVDQVQYGEGYMVGPITAAARYNLSSIAAPVFDRSGEVVLAVTLKGFSVPVGQSEIEEFGAALLRTTGAITAAIGGRAPIPAPDVSSSVEAS
jgi:DNA-binding IclR family transcriptional regulator